MYGKAFKSSLAEISVLHDLLAEREGFEPPIRLPVCRISSAVLSTTQPPLRKRRRTSRSSTGYVSAAITPNKSTQPCTGPAAENGIPAGAVRSIRGDQAQAGKIGPVASGIARQQPITPATAACEPMKKSGSGDR